MINRKQPFAPNAINVYRIVAAMSVFLLHATTFDAFGARQDVNGFFFWLFPSAWGGVFLFFLLGGYLAGKGFASGRYEMSVKGVLAYYQKRALRILIPTWAFLLFAILFVYPDLFTHDWKQVLAIVFLYFNGSESVAGVGAAWYVFTTIHLYLLTPFFHLLLAQCKKLGQGFLEFLLALFVMGGLFFRIIAGYVLHADWYSMIYTPFWGNLDLWLSGMILNYLPRSSQRRPLWVRITAGVFLGIVVAISAWYCYANDAVYSWYIAPTLFLIVGLFYLDTFDREGGAKGNTCLDRFASVSFEFYLFHSLILSRLSITFSWLGWPTWLLHTVLLTAGFALTLLFSLAFHKLFSPKGKQTLK